MTLFDASGRPIAVASAVKNRIREQAGDENMPNLTGAGNTAIEVERRLDGGFRLSISSAEARIDAIMSPDHFDQLIATMLQARS